MRIERGSAIASLVLLALVAGCAGTARSDRPVPDRPTADGGRLDARAALEAGTPRWFLIGKPLDPDSRLGAILRERYGITLVPLGCAVPPDQSTYARAYDDVVREAMERRHGGDVLEAALREDRERRDGTSAAR